MGGWGRRMGEGGSGRRGCEGGSTIALSDRYL